MNIKTRVLIVDDEKIVRTAIRNILEPAGYEVSEAENGAEALLSVAESRPDIILLDLVLLKEDGFDVCRMLRSDINSLSIPIITLSTGDNTDNIFKSLEVGANDYQIKPVSAEDLIAKIKSHLHLRRFSDDLSLDKTDLMTLLEISRAVSTSYSIPDILSIIAHGIARLIEVDQCSVVKIDDNGKSGCLIASSDAESSIGINMEAEIGPELLKAMGTKNSVILMNENLDRELREYERESKDFESIIVIPVIAKGESDTALFIRTSRKSVSFTQKELRLCQILVNIGEIALSNAGLFSSLDKAKKELEKLAYTDGLTGADNYRFFRMRLYEEFERAVRYQTPLSCLMLDIDFFKALNDKCGHAFGDMVLKEISESIKKNIRNVDMVARCGGEEFAILLPQTDAEGAIIQAERIRISMPETFCPSCGKNYKITASIGVATYPQHSINCADDLVEMSDKALYRAKDEGRNRTVAF